MIALRMIGTMFLAGLVLCAFSPLPNIAARRFAVTRDAMASEAIVVLGAEVRSDGALGDPSLRRLIAGIEEYKSGLAPRLVLLGSSRSGESSEAERRRQIAQQMGVPSESVLSDDQGRTTREEAERTSLLLRPLGVSRITLVSDGLHLDRARRAFSQQGFQVGVAPVNTVSLDTATPEGRVTLSRSLAQQVAAWLLYRATE